MPRPLLFLLLSLSSTLGLAVSPVNAPLKDISPLVTHNTRTTALEPPGHKPSPQETIEYIRKNGKDVFEYDDDDNAKFDKGSIEKVDVIDGDLRINFNWSFRAAKLKGDGTGIYIIPLAHLIPSKCIGPKYGPWFTFYTAANNKTLSYFKMGQMLGYSKGNWQDETLSYYDNWKIRSDRLTVRTKNSPLAPRVFKAIMHAANLLGAKEEKEESDPFM